MEKKDSIMIPHEERTLKTISDRLKDRFPDRIEAVYAFGSRVRGDFHEWSDFDVLVVVKGKSPRLESEIIDIFVDEETKAGLSFSPIIKDKQAFDLEKKYNTPFYDNITIEGVCL